MAASVHEAVSAFMAMSCTRLVQGGIRIELGRQEAGGSRTTTTTRRREDLVTCDGPRSNNILRLGPYPERSWAHDLT